MATRRAILAASALCACAPPQRPAVTMLGSESLIVAAESWHTDLCLPAAAVRGSALAPVSVMTPSAQAFAFGYGLDAWLRADRPGSAEALAAVFGGPASIVVRALTGPVPRGAEDQIALRLPEGGFDGIAGFITRQVEGPLPVATPDGAWILAPSRLRYTLGFTCNTWVMQALAEAGLPVPVGTIRLRSEAMNALRYEAARQART